MGEVVPGTGFKAQADIDEYYLGRVAIGQSADVTVDGKSYPMLVTRVNPQVKDATFQVELAFKAATPSGLLPGEALEGKLAVGGDRPLRWLPAGPFLERTGGDWVMVVSTDGGHAERRRIRLGARNQDQVEVLSGLSPGERVITSDYAAFEKMNPAWMLTMNEGNPMLKLENVAKVYIAPSGWRRRRWATVLASGSPDGEFVAIMGPSGCGKSTAAKPARPATGPARRPAYWFFGEDVVAAAPETPAHAAAARATSARRVPELQS